MSDTERGTVSYGTKSIPYRIERGRRRVSVAIVVDPQDGVVVRVPPNLELPRIRSVVHRKAGWIVRKLREHEDLLPAPAPREFESGETFLYLGRQHRLTVVQAEGAQRERVSLERGRIVVTIPAALDDEARRAAVRRALQQWYRRLAAGYLPGRLAKCASRLGVARPKLLVREPKKRWGSCDAKGQVRINWRIVQAAPRLVDYVLTHELVHLEYPKHDAEFWSRLGEVVHDVDARRDRLRRIGAQVVW